MQSHIIFVTSGANSVVGGYVSGDHARVSTAFAKHLVEDLGVAKYAKPKQQVPVVEVAEEAPKLHKKKK